jgi:hypothetical protein
MTGASIDTDLSNDRENNVFRRDTRRQLAVYLDGQCSRTSLQQALGCQDMADLGSADAKGQCPEGAMRARMTVAAHNGLAAPRKSRAASVNWKRSNATALQS